MRWENLTAIVKSVAETTNPKGTYFMGRKTEANFEYDKPFPQIHMLPPVLNEPGGGSDVASWNCTFIFYFEDVMADKAPERNLLINEAFKLRSMFKNNLALKPDYIAMSNITTSPTMLQLMAKASGVIMTATVAAKDSYGPNCGFIGAYELPADLKKC